MSTEPAAAHKHIIARTRNSIALKSDLKLEDHEIPLPERHFAGSQIELPHAAEALVIKSSRLSTVLLKANIPMQRKRGVEAAWSA